MIIREPDYKRMNRFERDKMELGWRAAFALWLENRTGAPKIINWHDPERDPAMNRNL